MRRSLTLSIRYGYRLPAGTGAEHDLLKVLHILHVPQSPHYELTLGQLHDPTSDIDVRQQGGTSLVGLGLPLEVVVETIQRGIPRLGNKNDALFVSIPDNGSKHSSLDGLNLDLTIGRDTRILKGKAPRL